MNRDIYWLMARQCSHRGYSFTARNKNIFRLLVCLTGVILILLVTAGSLSAQAPNPHGNFSSSTSYCLLCHDMHEAQGKQLGYLSPESTICFTCHNGTGSMYDIQSQMNLNPQENAMHPISVNLSQNASQYNYLVGGTTLEAAPPAPYDCSQCHEPHGETTNYRLLQGPYVAAEYVPYQAAPDPYAVCWACHDSTIIMNDTTLFAGHKRHIVDLQTSCTACHYSPHGVAYTELVRFNPGFVSGSVTANAGPTFSDLGTNRGSCTLTCHAKDHVSSQY